MYKIFSTAARKASTLSASSGRIINLTTPTNDTHINKFSTNKSSTNKSYWIHTAWPTTNLLNSVVGRA
jgi:hypothetical protein